VPKRVRVLYLLLNKFYWAHKLVDVPTTRQHVPEARDSNHELRIFPRPTVIICTKTQTIIAEFFLENWYRVYACNRVQGLHFVQKQTSTWWFTLIETLRLSSSVNIPPRHSHTCLRTWNRFTWRHNNCIFWDSLSKRVTL
jgi:hypothetical protein